MTEFCRHIVNDEQDHCGKPAEFIVWGKLFPKEALGPRCYDHMADQLGHTGQCERCRSQAAIFKIEDESTAERILKAQAELQTGLGFHRLDMTLKPGEKADPKYIEMRMAACLAMLHSLMGDLGRPMYQPAQMPEGWSPA
jgi:hypothetical protein